MNSEQGKAAADVLAQVWEGEFPATCAVLAAVKDDTRGYKPDAKSLTAWELATHLATPDIWVIDSITKGAFEWNPDAAKQAESPFQNVSDIVAVYKKTFPEKLAALRAQVLVGGCFLTSALANCGDARCQLQRAASRKRTPKK